MRTRCVSAADYLIAPGTSDCQRLPARARFGTDGEAEGMIARAGGDALVVGAISTSASLSRTDAGASFAMRLPERA